MITIVEYKLSHWSTVLCNRYFSNTKQHLRKYFKIFNFFHYQLALEVEYLSTPRMSHKGLISMWAFMGTTQNGRQHIINRWTNKWKNSWYFVPAYGASTELKQFCFISMFSYHMSYCILLNVSRSHKQINDFGKNWFELIADSIELIHTCLWRLGSLANLFPFKSNILTCLLSWGIAMTLWVGEIDSLLMKDRF